MEQETQMLDDRTTDPAPDREREGALDAERVAEAGAGAAREEKRVPIGEAIRYRKRAQDAESRLSEVASRLGEVEDVLEHTRDALVAAERARRIDLALMRAGAVDLDAARLVAEASIVSEEGVDIEAVVAELRRGKPFLFRARRARVGSAMGGRPMQAGNGLEDAAREAAASGERGALLRYLRARRESDQRSPG